MLSQEGMRGKSVAKVVSEHWRKLDKAEKAKFERMADLEREQHEREVREVCPKAYLTL